MRQTSGPCTPMVMRKKSVLHAITTPAVATSSEICHTSTYHLGDDLNVRYEMARARERESSNPCPTDKGAMHNGSSVGMYSVLYI